MATFQNDTQSEKEVSSIPCSSQASIDIVRPVTSSRQGRPSYMRSIIQKRHSELRFVLGEHYDEEALIADEAPDFEDPAEPITNDPRLEGEFDPDDSPRRRRQMLHRVSVQAVTDPKQLVQVKIKDLCYFVPVQTDVPTKQTVLNQSLCYFTYEFFARLRNLACRPHDEVQRKYVARQASDLFLPYTKKPILQNVNLIFQPGKTYLVLGPPQSGKTTLLKAISGRLPHTVDLHGEPIKSKPHRSGRIEYNGIAIEDDSRLVLPNVVSFVGQLDVHAPYLTVKETFDFAFRSRNGDPTEASPCNVPSPDGTKTENLTIAGLGLGHVQDTFVGNSEVRGVSGGQRRRVTIGEMMQGDTPVACADEISTGLDAAVTYDICKSIVDFSKAAKTTRVVSLLQPGPETFALFDEVIVLSEGNCVYAGPISDVIGYFDSLGYALPATVDAADFLQSVTTPDGALLFDPDRSSYTQHLNSEQFATAFASSDHGKRIESLLENPSPHDWLLAKGNDIETTGGTHPKVSGVHTNIPERFRNSFQNSWIRSFQLNFNRHLLLWWRDKGFIIGKTFENMGMAVATGGILFGQANLPRDLRNGFISEEADAQALQEVVDGVFSALFMTCLHILLGTTTSTPDDIDGRPIHYKHADANFYQTAAFAIGRTISTLPQRAIEIVAFGIPVYWMVGLDASAKSFFIYLAVVLSYTFTLKIMYGIIAQILPNKQNVLSFGTFLVLVFSLFGGFIVYPTEIPWYFTWIRYLNPMAWALQAVLINEFTSQKYPDDISLSVLRSRGFETSRDWIGYTFVFLFGYVVFWNALLALVLRVVRIEPKKAGSPMPLSQESQPKILEDFNLPFTPVDLAFEDVTYEVKPSTGDGSLRLLNKVNGIFRSGRLVALMGSSGAGKTTLMDVIALRKTSGTLSGDVRMNGFPQERTSFLRSSGYVEQFDVQQAELTVRETVVFSARLRLSRNNPVTGTDAGRMKFVDYVLDAMELTNISHLQVGSYEEGGLSFEQRKRLAIAVELAASPSVIFLDEPTSGLDARGALVIMRAMKRIADTGRTVVSTIHQPSSAVFEMFDDLLLLQRGGEVVFFGELGKESCELVEYFESNGADPIQYGENPAAWMLRAYTREANDFDWKEAFEQSRQFATLKESLAALKESPDDSKKIVYEHIFAASNQTQHTLMMRRIFRIMMRSPSYNLARLMIAIFYSLLIGTVFVRSKSTNKVFRQYQVDGVLSTIFLALIIIGVVSISMSVPVMKQIRDVFYKHRASGMLSHNSVTLAVTLGELPYIITVSAIFSAVYYSLVGLFGTADKWLYFFLFFGLNVATYTYFGQAFICLVKDIPTAGALVGALIGYNVFFSGLVVRPQYFSGPFQLGYWTAPGRFAFEGIVTTQFKDLDYTVAAEPESPFFFHLGCNATAIDAPPCTGTMESYVDFFFGGRFREDYLPLDLAVLFFCLFLARLLLYVALWKFNYVNT